MQVFTVNQLHESSTELIRQIHAKGYRHIYIHLDLDVVDPDDFLETKCPVSNGIGFIQLLRLLNELNETFQVVGYSLVEYAPLGHRNLTKLRQLVEYGLRLGT